MYFYVFAKTNHGQNNLSNIAPTTWNNLINFLKTAEESLNTYRLRVRKHFF